MHYEQVAVRSHVAFLPLPAYALCFLLSVFASFRFDSPKKLALSGFLLLFSIVLLGTDFYLEGALLATIGGLAFLPICSVANIGGRKTLFYLSLASLLAFSAFLWTQLELFSVFKIGYPDLGLYFQRIRETALFRHFLSAPPFAYLFFDHVNPALLLWVPLYWLMPGMKMIFVAQTLSLACVGFALYPLACRVLESRTAALFCSLAVLFHPSVSQMAFSISYGFHPVSSALPLLVLSVYFWHIRKWGPFIAIAITAVLFKETCATFYIAMGAVEFLSNLRKPGCRLSPFLLALCFGAYLTTALAFILPAFEVEETPYAISRFFKHMGDSYAEVIWHIVTHPGEMFSFFWQPRIALYLAVLLGSFLFLPLLAPRQLLYGSVSFAGTVLMSSSPDFLNPSSWYQADLFAAMAVSLPFAVKRLSYVIGRFKASGEKVLLPTSVSFSLFICSLFSFCSYAFVPFPSPWSTQLLTRQTLSRSYHKPPDPESRQAIDAIHEFAGQAPEHLRILTTSGIATAFLNHDGFQLLNLFDPNNLESWPDIALFDLADIGWGNSEREIRSAGESFIFKGQYKYVRQGNFLLIFRPDRDVLEWKTWFLNRFQKPDLQPPREKTKNPSLEQSFKKGVSPLKGSI